MNAVAARLHGAYASRSLVAPPSSLDPAFDLDAAYDVERQLVEDRRARGRKTVGLKVGYANKAVWRALKLQTLVWAHMYDDTVREASAGVPPSLDRMIRPKIEPEIVFKLARAIDPGADAAGALASVEWLALGFEIVDSVYPDGKFQPADFVAAYGFHAALIVGEPRAVTPSGIPALIEQLPKFTVRLLKDGALAAEGSGQNVLRSPALCLAELAAALSRRPGAEPLRAGDLITTGSLADAQPIAAGETWETAAEGLAVPEISVRLAPLS
jgi:2-oxo-3-hexenedioate decarboxylase